MHHVPPAAQELRTALHRSRATAAGANGWSAEDFLMLPSTFMEALCSIWAAMARTARIPELWLRTRVVGLPKSGGGTRPITIHCIRWRAGMDACVARCSAWAESCAPPHIMGGARGGDPAELHDLFRSQLEAAVAEDAPLYGVKLDLKQARDRIHAPHADAVLRPWCAAHHACAPPHHGKQPAPLHRV